MMNHLGKFLMLLAFLSGANLFAQINPDTLSTAPVVKPDTVIAFHSQIYAMTRYTGDSVILRWSPDQAGGWHVGNQIGYIVERTEIGNDSTYNPNNFKPLTTEPIKPWPLDDWEKIAGDGKDKYAAIAAQSLYGEGYKATGIFDNADEFRNRFSFALLAADFSPQTATALGLRLADRDVKKNRVYIYRIYLARQSENYTIDTAYQVVNTSEIDKLPEVKTDNVVEDELKVTFYWDREVYNKFYSAYYIERSRDGKRFERLNKEPYINALSNDFKSNQDIIIYTDSLTKNYEPYYYRFIGLTPFGELSKPSQPVTAMGRDRTPPGPPREIKTKALSSTSVLVSWKKEIEEPDMAGYVVSRSQDFAGEFAPLFTEPLPPSTRSFTDKSAVDFGTNYYMVSALDTAGNISNSIISYAMMIDSIPPAKPQNLTGTIDSTGLVTLKWSLGKEKNLKGYNIYFSNAKDHYFTSVNDRPFQDTVFYDTIQVKTLTEEIFYCIRAMDVNFSLSESSDTLRLTRPDIIPPTRPVITAYKVEKDGILLNWQNSSSHDAFEYVLYRKAKEDFEELAKFSALDSVSNYKDTAVEAHQYYTYALQTIDDAGLKSEISQPLKLKMRGKHRLATVDDVTVSKNNESGFINLSWSYDTLNVEHFVIYRAVDGRNFMTYKTLEPQEMTFQDTFVKKGSQYEYTIKVRFKDGRLSDFGKIVALKN